MDGGAACGYSVGMLRRFTDLVEQPWKNGQGVTREISRGEPVDSADGGGFLWRLSLADVGQSGPFSPFGGYDRVLTLLDGAGFSLAFENGAQRIVDTAGQPVEFDGGEPAYCTLLGGLSRDLNLMTRRDRASAEWQVLTGPASRDLNVVANQLAIIAFSLTGEARLRPERGDLSTLVRWDTAVLAPEESSTLTVMEDSAAFVAVVSRNPSG